MHKPIPRPSPATAIACLALFVALGGTGYAAIVLPKNSVGPKQIRTGGVTSKDVRNNTIRSIDVRNRNLRGRDIRPNSLRGRQIDESTLAPVPQAANADTLGGLSASQLKVRCPAGTVAASATCIETSARSPESFGQANATCALLNRRLPTYAELKGFLSFTHPVAAGGELTANVGESATTPGDLVAVVILNIGGSQVEFVDATGPTERAFRCTAAAAN